MIELSDYESWQVGFETGAMACIQDNQVKTAVEFATEMAEGQHNDLLLAMNFGRHLEHGIWSMVGIRMAVYMILLTDWDPVLRQDSSVMQEMWQGIKDQSPEIIAAMVAEHLTKELMIPIVMIDEDASRFISQFLK